MSSVRRDEAFRRPRNDSLSMSRTVALSFMVVLASLRFLINLAIVLRLSTTRRLYVPCR